MKFGYAYWGFLADEKVENGKIVSTPDGNATYSWSILWEAQQRGWETWLLQRDRDAEYVNGNMGSAFSSFSASKRWNAWKNAKKTLTTHDVSLVDLDELPDLDVVLIEWRFPIPGRNCEVSKDSPEYQPDLDRQLEILEYFKSKGTKIILWDLDHKLTFEDEKRWMPDAIFETSVVPIKNFIERTRVEPPIVIDELRQFKTVDSQPFRKLVYIGSRYERDDVIEEWIKPVSEEYPYQIEFWGNWLKEPSLSECLEMWPSILYNRRVTVNDFQRIYSTAVACPLLAKKSYLKSGFITPRPWEALMFGTLPVGLNDHLGVRDYVHFTADDTDDLAEIVDYLANISLDERDELRMTNIEKISFMDVKNFVNEIERIA